MSPPQKKYKHPTKISQRASAAPPSYPDTQCDLASHRGTPIFQETESGTGTMTLEEYLNTNKISYEEYLCRGDDVGNDEENGYKGWKRTKPTVVTPSGGIGIDPWLSVL